MTNHEVGKANADAAQVLTFQDMILRLQRYWADLGCVIMQPYDNEVGAGTFHTATTLRSLGPATWKTAYVQPCRRPTDGRYGENPNRLQHYYQFQVLLKPSPDNVQDLYLESLRAIGIEVEKHDIRFVEDDWKARRLALGVLAGKSGSMAWRSLSLLTSSRLAVSSAVRFLLKSPMVLSDWLCIFRA